MVPPGHKGLNKSKSKLALRFGLTSPTQPHTVKAPSGTSAAPPLPALPPSASSTTPASVSNTSSTLSPAPSLSPSPPFGQHRAAAEAYPDAAMMLNSSSSSSALTPLSDSSRTSHTTHAAGNDSRSPSAFALDLTPSPPTALARPSALAGGPVHAIPHSNFGAHKPFDMVSYQSISTTSLPYTDDAPTSARQPAFDMPTSPGDMSTGGVQVQAHGYGQTESMGYPTPSLTPSPVLKGAVFDEYSQADLTWSLPFDRHRLDPDPHSLSSPRLAPAGREDASTTSSTGHAADVEVDVYHSFSEPHAYLHAQVQLQQTQSTLDQQGYYHHKQQQQRQQQHVGDAFRLTDEQMMARFSFDVEMGFGNWGSVWLCKLKRVKGSEDRRESRLGRQSAGTDGAGRVAMKLVHLTHDAKSSARVRALWGEMKVIRSLKHEPHPSVIQLEAFIVTPTLACVVMPQLSHLIPVQIPPQRAVPYLRQLVSAVGYLHERGITHNDIKPANVMLNYNDVPVLIDFGFAQQWDIGRGTNFVSDISWGTPEYMDFRRAHGMMHDERTTDVWALGVTIYEILIGRTPFEMDEDERFESPEELKVYFERVVRGQWLGDWDIPDDLQHLIRKMLHPNVGQRITAMQAYHHPALHLGAPQVIITPHFVRAAQIVEDEEPMPIPAVPAAVGASLARPPVQVQAGKKKMPIKKKDTKPAAAAGPTGGRATPALGESIKQHTSVPRLRSVELLQTKHLAGAVAGDKASPRVGKVVIRSGSQGVMAVSGDKENKEDLATTPTKVVKPAQPLRVKEIKRKESRLLRTSASQAKLSDGDISSAGADSRPTSGASDFTIHGQGALRSIASTISNAATARHTAEPMLDKRASNASLLSSASTVGPNTKEEAMLRTMRSLEGLSKKKERDVLGKITRKAPQPPVVVEEESAEEQVNGGTPVGTVAEVSVTARPPVSPPRLAKRYSALSHGAGVGSPPRARQATKPSDIVRLTGLEKLSLPSTGGNTMQELRDKILAIDENTIDKLRRQSTRADRASTVHNSPAKQAAQAVQATESAETAEGLDMRLESLAAWVKNMEQMVQEARSALAQGRDPVLPLLGMPTVMRSASPAMPAQPIGAPAVVENASASPEKLLPAQPADTISAVPAHLRAMSTEVEPATPPKWAEPSPETKAEDKVSVGEMLAEESVKMAPIKGDRVHVATVFKRPASTTATRNNTPEPALVPLKPPASHTLRSAPSTPMLRSSGLASTVSGLKSKNLSRRSESNLRTLAAGSGSATPQISPRRAAYEDRLASQPGVVDQGEGWTSSVCATGPGMSASVGAAYGRRIGKTTSIASLRERALNFLRDEGKHQREREIVDLAAPPRDERARQLGKRNSFISLGLGRPSTPGQHSALAASMAVDERGQGKDEKKGAGAGFWGRLMRKGGKREDA